MQGETSKVHHQGSARTLVPRELSLGVDSLVRQSLKHEPPKPSELEHAIELTEEVVMPLASQHSGSTHLILQGLGAVLIARGLDSVGMKTLLSIEEIETLFIRLVAVSEGRPTSQEVLPTDHRFFAELLLLLLFMHNLNFACFNLHT